MNQAVIFDIQRYSSHDGPGIRSTVFFKGCPLRCKWCHNPESFTMENSILFTMQSCIGCGSCINACPDGRIPNSLDRTNCTHCASCVSVCPSNALKLSGKKMTVSDVMHVISRDIPFYESSNGGITLSGGEVLLQSDFAKELLMNCKEKNLHTAVDTAGYVPFESFEKVLPYTDLFLYDIKGITPELHKNAVGKDNALILENFKKLTEKVKGTNAKIWVRIPVIPGFTASETEILKIAEFLKEYTPDCVELLKFHRLAESKYQELGMDYIMKDTPVPEDCFMEELKNLMLTKLNCEVRIG